jgi:histidyl-tRNA synthetase
VMSLAESAPTVALKPDLYIAPLGSEMNGEAGKLARELRQEDFIVELGDGSFKLKKSFEAAAKVRARYVLFFGENEVQSNTFSLKNQETGEQISVPRSELVARLREILKIKSNH